MVLSKIFEPIHLVNIDKCYVTTVNLQDKSVVPVCEKTSNTKNSIIQSCTSRELVKDLIGENITLEFELLPMR